MILIMKALPPAESAEAETPVAVCPEGGTAFEEE